MDDIDPDISYGMRVLEKFLDVMNEPLVRHRQNLLGLTPDPPDDEGWIRRIIDRLPDESDEVRLDFDGQNNIILILTWNDIEMDRVLIGTPADSLVEGELPTAAMRQAVQSFLIEVRSEPLFDDLPQEKMSYDELDYLLRHETMEQKDWWTSLPDGIDCYEHRGIPHYLWLEWLDNRDIGKPITLEDLDLLYSSEVT